MLLVYQKESTQPQANPIRGGYQKHMSLLETMSNGVCHSAMESQNPLDADMTLKVAIYHADNSDISPALMIFSPRILFFPLVAGFDRYFADQFVRKRYSSRSE